MKLHVFGDSHVVALHAGARQLQQQLAQASIDADFYCRQGPNWRNVRTTKRGHQLRFTTACTWEPALDYTLDNPNDVYVFCAPLHTAGLWRDLTWREFCPWRSAKDFPGMHPLSDGMIESIFDDQVKTTLGMLKDMKELGYMVLVAEPPKPLQKGPAVDQLDPRVVISVDNFFRAYVFRRLTEIGVPVIRIPEFTHQNGLTPDQYSDPRPNDTHHGSPEFGVAMLKQIVQVAGGITLN
jgi:hypothetical protein